MVFWSQNGRLGFILEAQEAPKSRPKAVKTDVKKQAVFSTDFWRIRTSFWMGFWYIFCTENACKKRNSELCEKLTKHCVGARFFDVGSCNKHQNSSQNRWKIACFLGRRFWKDFGRVLGGPNPRFSLIFRHFFDVNFDMHFGRRKIRSQIRKNQSFPLFGVGSAVYVDLRGKI